jgi:hydroxymethylbilane synthase
MMNASNARGGEHLAFDLAFLAFIILFWHSSFGIWHLAFGIHHLAFGIWHSSFSIHTMHTTTIRIATRGSQLALAQTGQVAEMIRQAHPGIATELVAISTRGDRLAGSLAEVGGKGLFTRELEDALRRGGVDMAVHSAKDLPAAMDNDFTIVAVPAREDARDALASRAGGLDKLPLGATVGTGSLRRRAQLLALRADLHVVPIRGNVETRLRRAVGEAADVDAVVLAMAGLNRGGLAGPYGKYLHPLEIEQVIPAAGQGTLALQAMADREDMAQLLAAVEDADSRLALLAERAVLRGLGAGCQSCLAIHVSRREKGQWVGQAMAARPDGSGVVRLSCRSDSADAVGRDLLAELTKRGADKLIAAQ